MSFAEITEIIRRQGNAVHAYEAASKAAKEAALTEPERSIGYFMLAAATGDFAEFHYGEALQAKYFDVELSRFENYTRKLDSAFEDPNRELWLIALNEIARDLLEHIPSSDRFHPPRY